MIRVLTIAVVLWVVVMVLVAHRCSPVAAPLYAIGLRGMQR